VTEKARRLLDWTPETDLKEGVRKIVEWLLKQPA
jgi:nucleoside-diphosphate-sugar epimerase